MKNGCPNQASKQLKPNSQMEKMVKMTKKDQGERGMEKNPLLLPDRKPYMVTNSLWQRAMWQSLEKPRNPCTQYKPHNDANSRWTLNRRSRSTHIIFIYFFNQVVSTSEASRGYSHHLHIEKERTNSRSKRERKERKNKLNSRSAKNLTDPNTKPYPRESTKYLVWSTGKNNRQDNANKELKWRGEILEL